ncbi:MAG: LysR family transcriptional regulator [Hyphomicrobiaceae bacterium]
MAITFRQLQQFLVLAEELHFGKAAKRLAISQPPLSASLKQLEQTLGYALMIRTKKSVHLTPAGAVFAGQVRRILEELGLRPPWRGRSRSAWPARSPWGSCPPCCSAGCPRCCGASRKLIHACN